MVFIAMTLLILGTASVMAATTLQFSGADCNYLDMSFVNVTIDANANQVPPFVSIRQPVHSPNAAMDVLTYYLGQVNPTPTFVDNSCFNLNFNDQSANVGTTTVTGYLKFVISNVASANSMSGMFAYGFGDQVFNNTMFPGTSAIYLPVVNAAANTAINNTRTVVTLTGTNPALSALLNSSLNVQGGGNANGHFILRDANSLVFVARQVYYLPNYSLVASSPSADSSCPSATGFDGGSPILRQCGLQYGALRAPINGLPYPIAQPFPSLFRVNFCLWTMIVLILLYFFFALGASKDDPLMKDYENNSWFNHPFYSYWVYQSPRQTKISRLTLLVNTIFAFQLVAACINWGFMWDSVGKRVGVSIAVGFPFGWIVTHLFSIPLNYLLESHRKFLRDFKTCQTHEKKEECINGYNNERQIWNYIFYSATAIWFMGCGWGCIGILINFTNTPFWWFMLSFGILIVGEFAVFDVLRVFLGSGDGKFAKFIQSRTYYLDYKLLNDFNTFLQEEDVDL